MKLGKCELKTYIGPSPQLKKLDLKGSHQNEILALVMRRWPSIDLSFLSMTAKFEGIKLPRFVAHRFNSKSERWEDFTISHFPRYTGIILGIAAATPLLADYYFAGISTVPLSKCVSLNQGTAAAFEAGICEFGCEQDICALPKNIKYIHSFVGIVPSTIKESIAEALPAFVNKEAIGDTLSKVDNVFLIQEATSWRQQTITVDPLIVGVIDSRAFLIDHYDETDIESYVRREFTT